MLKPVARLAARSGLAVLAVLLATGPIGPVGPAAAQRIPIPHGVITLTSQNAWVQSSNVPVRLGLTVRSPVAAKDLLVTVALYTEPDQSALASRDEFDATLTGQLAGLNRLALKTFSLRSIRQARGSLKFYVGGSELSDQVPAKAPADRVFQLPCPPRYGGCGGVYPLQVSLVDVLSGQPVTIDSLTTYLVVVPSTVASQKRLRFSFVLPVGASIALSATGSPSVPAATLAAVETIARTETSWSSVPLSVDLYGQTLLALAGNKKLLKLVKKIAYGGHDSLIGGPFSDVDPTQLVRAGLERDLASQIEYGNAVFEKVLHTFGASHIFVATAPVGPGGLAALAADGIGYIVVAQSNLESTTSRQPSVVQWPYTLSAPFFIPGSIVEGLQADPGLSAHLTGAGSPALRAQQLLADLAEIYFDSPDYPMARGVALVAPDSWVPQPEFLSDMLTGLRSSPIVTTLPLRRLFSTVRRGNCQLPPVVVNGCSAAVRALASPALPSGGSATSGQVQAARSQLAELSSVIPTGAGMIHGLEDAMLLAETAGLSPSLRQAYLSAPHVTMLRLGSQLGLPAGRTVTVTSASARFPIAITSSSRTPIHAILVVSGQDLSSSPEIAVVLRRGTTSLIVRVHTRTSGDSSLQLQLLSPVGHLQLARVELTIRSTAISNVAIALTIGAVVFLLFWWFRSASRRHRRRAKHVSGQLPQRTSEAVQERAS